jgi:nitroimidazol reductase NimA-like FMN-containing flavoprotein (pyridoxamine 5'-phosphate oxidase superfamily)
LSRRAEIRLTPDEQRELLESERVVVVSSLGSRGWPHSMPLWYVLRDEDVLAPSIGRSPTARREAGGCPHIWIWTYAKSQKVRNLERDPRATLLVETGHEYTELRGVMIEAEAEIHRDLETVSGFGKQLTVRYSEGIESVEGDAAAALEAQAAKRVAIHFHPRRTATWDHRKLGGRY